MCQVRLASCAGNMSKMLGPAGAAVSGAWAIRGVPERLQGKSAYTKFSLSWWQRPERPAGPGPNANTATPSGVTALTLPGAKIRDARRLPHWRANKLLCVTHSAETRRAAAGNAAHACGSLACALLLSSRDRRRR
jgi:hypothetical protein